MQVTVTLQASNENETAQIARVLSFLHEMLPETKVATSGTATAPAAITPPEEKPKATRTRRTKAQIAADKKAEEDAKKKAAEAELLDDGEEAVTLDDLKAAVRECVDARGVDAVKAIFEEAGAEKLSGLKEADYADVLAKLKA